MGRGPGAAAPPPARHGAVTAHAERLLRSTRTMVRVRWAGLAFAVVQVATFYLPYPDGILPLAIGLVVALALGNAALWWGVRAAPSEAGDGGGERRARRLAVASLVLDAVVVLGLVVVFTFDADTAMFALIYVLPLEGAILFQLRGALAAMGFATAAYVLRELYGAAAFGNELLATSISFRMGIGWIIAGVAGIMAANLTAERDDLEAARDRLEEAAAALRRTNEDLRVARQVQDDFLAMTNHELRTPLTAILGYTALLRRRWATMQDAARLDAVARIAKQGERLRDLVEDLLTISAMQAGGLHVAVEPVRLATVVEEVAAPHGPDVVVRCPPDAVVCADPLRLGQVLGNLLSNARKYGRPPVRLAAEVEPDRVVVSVHDAGAGVPEAFRPQLFERFTQASQGATREAEGTGLGLAIVKELVEAQGGTVWYDDAAAGARFCVALRRSSVEPQDG